MPRAAQFKIAAIENLLRQLEYAPAETRRRQMDAAERLIADLDPKQNYPEEFIIFRITGYRPDQDGDSATLVGQALLPDLINLVQALSETLDLPAHDAKRHVLSIEEVAQRLQISLKSIQRYRKQGLVCHYIAQPDGSKKLACYEDALARFMHGRTSRLDKAATFSRLNEAAEVTLIEQARVLHLQERLSLNETAKRLAVQIGRAHETVRMLLRRHDRRAAEPIFAERGPLTDRDVQLIHRAWQRGVEPALLARRFGKTKPTIHRAINRRRRNLLRTVELSHIKLPTFERHDAASVILSARVVNCDLQCAAHQDVIRLVEQARDADKLSLDVEHALIAGFNFLKMRCAKAIAALGEWPRSDELDAIETDLRWIALLQRRLVMLGFPAAVEQIEQYVQRPVTDQPADELLALIALATQVIAEAVDTVDPSRRQRLDRLVRFAIDRSLAQSDLPRGGHRAAAKHHVGSILMIDPFEALAGWNSWLGLRHDLQMHVRQLSSDLCQAVISRYGLDGSPPQTIPALAARLNMKPLGVVRTLQRAMRELRRCVRGNE